MTPLDWIVLSAYIVFIVGLSGWIGRRRKSQEDYYLGGRAMPPWQIALSIMATQVGAISLVLTYCAVGVLLIPFLRTHPGFASKLSDQPADFLLPYFLIAYFPKGIPGILLSGFPAMLLFSYALQTLLLQ